MLKKPVLNLKGFTLVELLLASAILAFVAFTLLRSIISSSILAESNRNLSNAITHAQYVMEEIKSANFTNITTKINNGYWNWGSTTLSSKGLSPLTNENITTALGTGTSDLLNVTVAVNWTDRGSRARNTSIQTFFSRP
jgi:prepilin-type N-terminal cleavage/methylation domain-containing protein